MHAHNAHNASARSSFIPKRAAMIFAVIAATLLLPFGVPEETAPGPKAPAVASVRSASARACGGTAASPMARAGGGTAASPMARMPGPFAMAGAGNGAPRGSFAAGAVSRASPWLGLWHIVIGNSPGTCSPSGILGAIVIGKSSGAPPPNSLNLMSPVHA